MLTTMIKIPWLHYRAGGILDFTPMLGGHKKTMRNIDCCGKPWVAERPEPISPRVAVSLGESMLGCNIGWTTKEGCPFGRTIGRMVRWYHPGRDPDLFPRVVIALTVGNGQPRMHFPVTKNFIN